MREILNVNKQKNKFPFTVSRQTWFGIVLLFLLPVFVNAQKTDSVSVCRPVSDTILIGAEPNLLPYSFINEKGIAEGFAIDIFKAVAGAAGLKVKIKIGLWNTIKQDLVEGRIDALPVVGRTPEREEIFDFTLPYLTLTGAVFALKSDQSIQTLDDLKNKKIVVMKDDNSDEFVRREKLSNNIFTTNTLEEAFKMLAIGDGDVVVTQKIVGLKIIDKLKLNRKVVPLDIDTGFRQDFCIAVREGDTELLSKLNEGLSVIIADNTFEKIREKWFGPVLLEKVGFKDVARIMFIILIPLTIVMILLWIIFMRREIKRRTNRLYHEFAEHQHTLSNLKEKQQLLETSEQQIRLLLNSTAEGIYGVDMNNNCTFVNKSALKLLGFNAPDDIIGKNVHHLIHHTKSDGTECRLEDCVISQNLKNGIGISVDTDIFWRSDKTSFQVEFSSFPIREGEILTGAVITFRDITERKKAENELIQLKSELEVKVAQRTVELEEKVQKLAKSQKALLFMVEDLNRITAELKEERRKLEKSNQELDAFTYSVSHDLRAPLRAINGFAGFLHDDYFEKLDDEGKRFIQIIRQNANRMDQLINDMLMLSRISRTEKRLENVDFNVLIETVITEIREHFPIADFEFNIQQLPIVQCDMNLFKQVWQNLIQNAVKYSSKSEIKKIEIGVTEAYSSYRFFIKDHGAGFDPRYVSKLFGVFQRLHNENDFEGTGVGLAIVKQIVSLHGGSVEAAGEVNKGAAFYFTVPRKSPINNLKT